MALRSQSNTSLVRQPDPPETGVLGTLWVDSDASLPNLFQLTSLSPLTYSSISGGGGGGTTWGSITGTLSSQTDLQTALDGKDDLGAAAAAQAASQPLDADLTALAAAGNSAVLAATTASFLLADETKLDGIAAGATVGATWNSNITSQPSVVSQAEAEAGVATTERIWTAERVNQAIQALAPGGGGGGFTATQTTVDLPYPARRSHRVTVTDAAVGSTNKIVVSLAGVAPTQANEHDAVDPLAMQAYPGTGAFEFQISFLTPAAGPLVINYARAA